MPLFKDLAGLLRGPVGNNLENDPRDVEILKHNFAKVGRYKRPVENGYIDQELDDSIWSFQKEYGLKQDGRVNAGGETEATLIGAIRGYEKPRSSKNTQQASATTIPMLMMRLAPLLGGTAMAMETWKNWQEKTTEGRENDLRKLEEEEKRRKDRCYKDYESNLKACERVYEVKGSDAYRACKESATTIFGQCNRGIPEEDRRRLQT